jgi:hypothetical protein
MYGMAYGSTHGPSPAAGHIRLMAGLADCWRQALRPSVRSEPSPLPVYDKVNGTVITHPDSPLWCSTYDWSHSEGSECVPGAK